MSASDNPASPDQPRLGELITLKEAARLSGLSYSHLRHLARRGHLWARKLGPTWVTTERAVRAYLARERRPGPKPRHPPKPGREALDNCHQS